MLAHPARPITIYDVGCCLGKAFPMAMTPRNITKSFEVTGIHPFNSEIFTEDEYLSSYVTDRPQNDASNHDLSIVVPGSSSATITSSNQLYSETALDSVAASATELDLLAVSATGLDSVTASATILDSVAASPKQKTITSATLVDETAQINISLEDLRPFPKAGPRKTTTRGRKKGSTKILTDTPVKNAIENELSEREARQRQKAAAGVKRSFKKNTKKCQKNVKKRRYQTQHEDNDEDTETESENIPPSPESEYDVENEYQYSDSDSDVENDEEDSDEHITVDDWVVVNFVSEKNFVHRFVGQITTESLACYEVKFAKKITEI